MDNSIETEKIISALRKKNEEIIKNYCVDILASNSFDYYDLKSSDGYDKVFADAFKLGFLAGFNIDKECKV